MSSAPDAQCRDALTGTRLGRGDAVDRVVVDLVVAAASILYEWPTDRDRRCGTAVATDRARDVGERFGACRVHAGCRAGARSGDRAAGVVSGDGERRKNPGSTRRGPS